MYICEKCGNHFEHFKVRRYESSTGWEDQVCPICESENFTEAGHCIKCGGYFPLDDMIGSICKECVEKRATIVNAYQYGLDRNIDTHELDGASDKQIRDYCMNDKYDFSEWLEGQEE